MLNAGGAVIPHLGCEICSIFSGGALVGADINAGSRLSHLGLAHCLTAAQIQSILAFVTLDRGDLICHNMNVPSTNQITPPTYHE